MHDCIHGYACYCSGDINDHDTGDEYTSKCHCDCPDDDDDFDDDYDCYDEGIEDERDEWVLVCGYEGCCMPGYHFRHECHNAQDIEAMYAEHEGSAEGKSGEQS